MTIGTTTIRASFNCDGVSKVFPIAIQAYLSTDFSAYATSSTGVTTLVLNSDYTLAASGTLSPSAWTLTTTVAYPTGTTLQVICNPSQTQQTQYVQGQAFPSLAVQTNMDRLTQMVQRLQDISNRSIHAPDGDVSPIMLLPSAKTRAGSALIFDSSGNATLGTPVTGTISTSVLAPFLGQGQTAAELAAGVTPVNMAYKPGDLRRYGAAMDGITDDCQAFYSAAQVGGDIYVPGKMAMASASLAALPNKAIALKSLTTVKGIAGFTCTITGTTPCNVFWSTNASGVKIEDFFCVGNGSNSATSTTGYFWYIQCTAAATGEMSNNRMIRGGLQNFAGLYWIYVDNTAAVSFAFTKFECDGSHFTSKAGNCQGPADITSTSTVLGFSGSDTVRTFYSLKDVKIRNCTADGTFIKNFVTFWSGVFRGKVYNNTLFGFGTDATISDDTGCYALSAYDHSHGTGLTPDQIEFYDNTIDGVRDCGIYCAGPNRITVANNRITGQTSTANGTIPKGAIALNGPVLADVHGNVIDSCAIGICITQHPQAQWARFKDNMVQNVITNGVGLWLSGTSGGNAPDIGVDGISVSSAAAGVKGIHLVFTASVGINNLDIQNFDITSCANGIDLFAPDSSVPNMGNVRIGRGKLRKISGSNLQWLNCTNAGSRSTFDNIDFMDMVSGAVGFFAQGCVNLTVRNFTFYELTGPTFCWYGANAQGRVESVRFVNVGASNRVSGIANEMGSFVPTWTGAANDFVQDLQPTELGSAGSKYNRLGWQWGRINAAWTENRSLTGN